MLNPPGRKKTKKAMTDDIMSVNLTGEKVKIKMIWCNSEGTAHEKIRSFVYCRIIIKLKKMKYFRNTQK